MKKLIIVILAITSFNTIAQDSTSINKTDTSYWDLGAKFGAQFTRTSFFQWTAGGENSYAVAGLHNSFANYEKGNITWENVLDVNYGIIKQGEQDLRKTDDRIELNSTFGYKSTEKWYYSGAFNFRSQFAPGYSFNEDGSKSLISNALSPGYISLSLGMKYRPIKGMSFNISPITNKTTIVLDESLSNIGAFGVGIGENVRYEVGGQVRFTWKQEIFKNIEIDTRLLLFSNYLENPQNIDVNWDAMLTFKVNNYINFNIITVLIYDHDILVPKDTNGDGFPNRNGRGIQFKDVLAIGLTLNI